MADNRTKKTTQTFQQNEPQTTFAFDGSELTQRRLILLTRFRALAAIQRKSKRARARCLSSRLPGTDPLIGKCSHSLIAFARCAAKVAAHLGAISGGG